MGLWEVFTPQYQTWHDIAHYDPAEYGSDWAMVEAPTARAAKVLAVREWRRDRTDWISDCRSDNRSPFTGLTALPVLYGPDPAEAEDYVF